MCTIVCGIHMHRDNAPCSVSYATPPEVWQRLCSMLDLTSSCTSHVMLQVVDRVPFLSGVAGPRSYKFCVTSSGGPMKVTLVWHDPPAALSSGTQLVNDLDLTVHANSLNGHGLYGNGVKDRLNNVEQVSHCTDHLQQCPSACVT